jgi:hypothetical protein
MPDSVQLPGYHWFGFLRNIPVRVGIYAGVCLSVFFTAWLLVANRVPFLEPFALHRNVSGVVGMACLASIPILRFYRAPCDLLASGLLAWTLLSVTYQVSCLVFPLLDEKYSAFHVFVLGAVVYMIGATLSWLGTILWRARAAHGSHPNH